MPFDFATVTKLIQSPPGQLVAGAALAGIVWKVFEKVENVLSDATKFEIAVWLVGVDVGKTVAPWTDALSRLFQKVFGDRHFSLLCFRRSVLATFVTELASALVLVSLERPRAWHFSLLGAAVSLMAGAVPDYLTLGETRLVILALQRTNNGLMWLLWCAVGLIVTILTADLWTLLLEMMARFNDWMINGASIGISTNIFSFATLQIMVLKGALPALVSSIWIWLYVGSGFLLKAAGRFDIGFQWFNRKFDIEKKPLSAIGLVSGALVAVAYWTVAVAVRVFK